MDPNATLTTLRRLTARIHVAADLTTPDHEAMAQDADTLATLFAFARRVDLAWRVPARRVVVRPRGEGAGPMKPTHTTKGGVQVVAKGRPEVVLGQARVRCYRLTGGFHGWIKVAQLTPVTR
jgi:hypothetical protein